MRKSLSEILTAGSDRDRLRRQWAEVKPADDFGKPLPRGEYIARITGGELFNSQANKTPGYKLTFTVIEGEHAGRKVWLDLWLSEAAIAMTKRDLLKLGVTVLEQLDNPLPPGIRCRLQVVVRKDDDGSERNQIRTFEVVGIDPPQLDPFAPKPANEAAGVMPPSTTPITTANSSPHELDGGKG
jgi:hypothetical protein